MTIINNVKAAKIIGCHQSTVITYAFNGTLKSKKIGKSYSFDSDYIEEFAKTYTPTPKGKRKRKSKSPFNPEINHLNKRERVVKKSWDEMVARSTIRVANNTRERLAELLS